jgi:hypothetical protein
MFYTYVRCIIHSMYNAYIRRLRRERRAAIPFAKDRCVLRFVFEEWRSDFVSDPRRRWLAQWLQKNCGFWLRWP